VTGDPGRHPGDPATDDEEAFEAELAEEAPVSPEAAAVADGETAVGTDEVEAAAADDETRKGEVR